MALLWFFCHGSIVLSTCPDTQISSAGIDLQSQTDLHIFHTHHPAACNAVTDESLRLKPCPSQVCPSIGAFHDCSMLFCLRCWRQRPQNRRMSGPPDWDGHCFSLSESQVTALLKTMHLYCCVSSAEDGTHCDYNSVVEHMCCSAQPSGKSHTCL